MYVYDIFIYSYCGLNQREKIFRLAPLRAPAFITAHNSSSTSLLVKWTRLSGGDFRGQPIGYNIAYYPAEVDSDINFVSVNHTRNTTTLTSLTAYTMYVINVSAVSSGGKGPANTVKARTDVKGIEAFLS